MLPWVFKLLYGAVCDTIPIRGYRKRYWMIMMGAIQFGALLAASRHERVSLLLMTFLLTVSSFASAFMDVIVDALMVMQAKRDPE
jgi:MFS-type transporter involved in bile tolerance (Atg22 family)